MKRRGPGRPPGPLPELASRDASIIAAYRRGLSLRRCAKRFGLSMQNVHRIVLRDVPRAMRAPYVMR